MFQARYYKDLLLRSIAGPTNVLARQIAENGFQTSKLQRPLRALLNRQLTPRPRGDVTIICETVP